LPHEGIEWNAKDDILSLSEITRLSELFVGLGVRKIRLTGGEPLIRNDIPDLLDKLGKLKNRGLRSLGITTNGILLANRLTTLIDSQVDSINLSLDSLNRERYRRITQRDSFNKIWDVLHQVIETDRFLVKLNCVVMRGVNDDEIMDFVRLSMLYPIAVRFIEFMPFGGNRCNRNKMVSLNEIKSCIERETDLIPRYNSVSDTALSYTVPGGNGTVGFIASMSSPFCDACNRIRLTADGSVKACLFGKEELSLRDMMRTGATDSDLVEAVAQAIAKKHAIHGGRDDLAKSDNRPMISIGG